LIASNKFMSISVIAKKLGIGTTAVENNLKKLKEKGAIAHIGSARSGEWRVNG